MLSTLIDRKLQMLLCCIKSNLPFMVHDGNFAIIAAHHSSIADDLFFTKDQDTFLLTSSEKAEFYSGKKFENAAKFKIIDRQNLAKILASNNYGNNFCDATDAHLTIINTVKKAEAEPILLITEKKFTSRAQMHQFANTNAIFSISLQEMSNLLGKYQEKIQRASSSNIRLKCNSRAKVICYKSLLHLHCAILIGDLNKFVNPLVRIHSSCYTGDLLGSLACDCQDQLHSAIKKISLDQEGGVLIYLMQEGRGIGLDNKIKTYALQSGGMDTVSANLALGFLPDERDFKLAKLILDDLGIKSIRLLTNNPEKMLQVQKYGIKVAKRVQMQVHSNEYNKNYLRTKSQKLGHKIYDL